jgi:luciferase family oxidoreductase group 1
MAQSETAGLRLSVLDQVPVAEGGTPAQALANAVELAQHVERLGYRRFWMSEHHAMEALACTAPEVVLARIGAATERIRIGSGGIMLPHYSPYKVAECFRTLAALYPGRVDLGVGRAPGGGPAESRALRRDRSAMPKDDFPEQLTELLGWLDGGQPVRHPFAGLPVEPSGPGIGLGSPDVWLLGSSPWSSVAAAELGLPYAFAHFFSPVAVRGAIENYRRTFTPSAHRAEPEAMAAVGVICAPTDEEAQYLHASVRLLQQRIGRGIRKPIAAPDEALQLLGDGESMGLFPRYRDDEGEFPRYYVGSPETVRRGLEQMAGALGLRELVVVTITHSQKARLRSYELLAKTFELGSPEPYAMAGAGGARK